MKTISTNRDTLLPKHTWSNIKNVNQDTFTVDDIIVAYEKGCDVGFNVSIQKMRKELRSRLNEVLPLMQNFYDSINENTSICKLMFLKLIGINKFDFIIALDKESYYNDEFCRPVYDSSFKLSEENNGIAISFMPYSDSFNYDSLKSDNFIAVYGKSE